MKHILYPLCVALLLLSLLPRMAFSQYSIVSPGIKLSYTFGSRGGLTVGGEVSFLKPHSAGIPGIVMDADYCTVGRFRMHLGLELGPIEAGPVYSISGQESYAGLNLTIQIPVPLVTLISNETYRNTLEYLYYTHSFMFSHPDLNEAGIYSKYYPNGNGSIEPEWNFD